MFSFPCFAFDVIAMTLAEEFALVPFNSLKHLHSVECNSLVKFAYKLFMKLKNYQHLKKRCKVGFANF